METYRILSRETYPRRAHLDYFCTMAQPYAGLTVPVDITDFYQAVGARKVPFFLSFLYCAARAANGVPELRQRLRGEEILEYDHCPTSHTVALEDGTYCYCTLRSDLPFSDYLPHAIQTQEAAKAQRSLDDGGEEDALPLLFISTLPWVHYEALVQPTPSPADTNPRITWGRFRREGDRVVLPVSLLCHHGLVDGLHRPISTPIWRRNWPSGWRKDKGDGPVLKQNNQRDTEVHRCPAGFLWRIEGSEVTWMVW